MTQILQDAKEPSLPARTRWAILAVVLVADVLDATTLSLVVVAAAIAVCLPLVGLLPHKAPEGQGH
ncbi:hypothetical protein ACWD1Y_08295 [Streptomyces sp. NPDC002814]